MSGERGSASVEFVVLLVGIVVPLVHLLVGIVEVHATAAAVEAAAQGAARAGVVAHGMSWRDAARDAAELALRRTPHGRQAEIEVTDEDGDGALGRGEYLDVSVRAKLAPAPPLPWAVYVEARGAARADPCRSIPGVGAHVELQSAPSAPACPE